MTVNRRLRNLLLALFASFSLVAYGCGGGGTSPKVDMTTSTDGDTIAPEGDTIQPDDGPTAVLAGVPANHGLDSIDSLTVQPGSSGEYGYVEISCPAGGSACVLSVTNDGTVAYETTGGTPSIMLRSLTADEIEVSLNGVEFNSDGEVFLFGGVVAVCLALHCPQGDTIYVRGITGEIEGLDTSEFEFVGQREGVFLAEKEFQSQDEYALTNHRSLGGWMEHSMFVVSIQERQPTNGFETYYRYDLSSAGHLSGTNPAAPPSGSATWSGAMAGIIPPYYSADDRVQVAEEYAQFVAENGGDFVGGTAIITVPSLSVHSYPSLNVEFSNIMNDRTGARRSDMLWEGVEMVNGIFGSAGDVSSPDLGYIPSIGGRTFEGGGALFGQFYGPDHEEVGGLFTRDGISGTFGARRDEN